MATIGGVQQDHGAKLRELCERVVDEDGAEVITLAGAPLAYGKPGFENPHFVAAGLPG